MRETVRSLRIYLFLTGTLSTLIYLSHLVSADLAMVARAIAFLGFLTSAGLLYVAVLVRKLLVEAPQRILGILYANMAFAGVIFALSLASTGVNLGAVIGIVILVYLRSNVIRLSNEENAGEEAIAA